MQKNGIINVGYATKQEPTMHELNAQLNQQNAMFKRVIENNKNRIHSLEKEVGELALKLNKSLEFIEKIKDKEIVSASRNAANNRIEKEPSEKPIDRNNVAPKDVDIKKIFYFGNR
jgi:ribosomal protein L9